ncbi:MAG: hypothetical protein JJU05_19090 [Verrucomicrobia bacterium]|nr:hypothetical protein [Verrucomicrobiota bacterium]MCH8528922.1 hypothetical protein [Kiritimatiellia bacterium]
MKTKSKAVDTIGVAGLAAFAGVAVFLILFTGCQSRRVRSFRVEDPFGKPISGARIQMMSMNSGHPIYPEIITGEDGMAPLQSKVAVDRSFLYRVIAEDEGYSFAHSDLRWEEGVLVIRLKQKPPKLGPLEW